MSLLQMIKCWIRERDATRYCARCLSCGRCSYHGAPCVKATSRSTPYTLADVGCYVDSVRGIYAIDRIVEIAIEHGMAEPDMISRRDDAGGVEDQCDEYMNGQHAVDGAFWGRSEQGDWGLWLVAEEENAI